MDNPAYLDDLDEETEKPNPDASPEVEPEKVYSFEEAVGLTETGKYHYFLLLVGGLCFMAVMVETMGISLNMPFITCDLQPTLPEQGFLASVGFLGIVLSSHAMGFLADTWGRVKTLQGALILGLITSVISAFSVNVWMLIAFRFLNGFFISGCQACVFSFVGEFHGLKTRVKYVTLLSMFMPIGLVFVPAVAMGVLPMQLDAMVLGIELRPWRLLLIVNCIPSFLALCGLLLTPESPKFMLVQGKHEEAINTLRMVFRLNTGRAHSEYPVKEVCVDISGCSLTNVHGLKNSVKLIWNQTVPLFQKERGLHTINICFVMFIIYCISQGTFMWFPIMLNQLVAEYGRGYSVCEVMYITSKSSNVATNTTTNATSDAYQCGGPVQMGSFKIFILIGVALTIVYLIFAFTIDIIGKRNLLLIWSFIVAICCLAIHWVSSFTLSIILLTLAMAMGNCGGIVSTMAIEYYPTNISAMAMCLIMMIGRLGAVAGSNFIGLVIFTYCNLLFYIYVGLIVIVVILALFLPEKGRKKEKQENVQQITTIDISLSQNNKHQIDM